jgi:hypothetical protein
MIRLIFKFATVVLLTSPAAAEQRTFYGADGRVSGRAATDTQGTTTFYDPAGRVTGRATGAPVARPGLTRPAPTERATGPR